MEELLCSNCPLLTGIPDTLINLFNLDYDDCPLSTSIPDTLVNLTYLDCSNCPLLTSIPDTLVNLEELLCSNCPLLTSIPDTLVNLTELDCINCPWIDKNKTKNIQKLITFQRFVKKYVKYQIFSRWIKSKEGVEWIYHSDNIGGKIAKKQIENLFK